MTYSSDLDNAADRGATLTITCSIRIDLNDEALGHKNLLLGRSTRRSYYLWNHRVDGFEGYAVATKKAA